VGRRKRAAHAEQADQADKQTDRKTQDGMYSQHNQDGRRNNSGTGHWHLLFLMI